MLKQTSSAEQTAPNPRAEHRTQLQEVVKLAKQLLSLETSIHAGISTDKQMDLLQAQWSAFCKKNLSLEGMDSLSVIQWIMQEAYTNPTEALSQLAQHIKFFNELKNAMREELQKARRFMRETPIIAPSHHQPGKYEQPYRMLKFQKKPSIDINQKFLLAEPETQGHTQETNILEHYIKDLDKQFDEVSHESQEAVIRLQHKMAEQKRVVNIFDNIFKLLQETSVGIIQKTHV